MLGAFAGLLQRMGGRRAGFGSNVTSCPEAQSLLNQTVKRSIKSYAGLTDQRPAVKA